MHKGTFIALLIAAALGTLGGKAYVWWFNYQTKGLVCVATSFTTITCE